MYGSPFYTSRMSATRRSPAVIIAAAVVLGIAVVALITPVARPEAPAAAPDSPALDDLIALRVPGAGSPDYSTERDTVVTSGVLDPDRPINVANLTIRPGAYVVGYSFEADLSSAGATSQLECGVVDANGRGGFLFVDDDRITAGAGWQRRSVLTPFALPDITLGLRCRADTGGVAVASFRDIRLVVFRTGH